MPPSPNGGRRQRDNFGTWAGGAVDAVNRWGGLGGGPSNAEQAHNAYALGAQPRRLGDPAGQVLRQGSSDYARTQIFAPISTATQQTSRAGRPYASGQVGSIAAVTPGGQAAISRHMASGGTMAQVQQMNTFLRTGGPNASQNFSRLVRQTQAATGRAAAVGQAGRPAERLGATGIRNSWGVPRGNPWGGPQAGNRRNMGGARNSPS